MTVITTTDLQNAKVDADDFGELVNGFSSVATRTGGTKKSYSQYMQEATHGAITAYDPSATYTDIDDWVSYVDTSVSPQTTLVYRPIPNQLPIAPTSPLTTAPDPSKWVVTTAYRPGNYPHATRTYASTTALRQANSSAFTAGDIVYIYGFGAGQIAVNAASPNPVSDNDSTTIVFTDNSNVFWKSIDKATDYADLQIGMQYSIYFAGQVVNVTNDGIAGAGKIGQDTTSPISAISHDGGVTITQSGSTTTAGQFYWERIYSSESVMASWWGVVNGVNASNAANLNAALSSGAKIIALNLTSPDFGDNQITVPSAVELQGLGTFKTIMNFKRTSGIAVAVGGSTSSTNSSQVRDLSITNIGGTVAGTVGLQLLDNTRNGINVRNVVVGDFSQLHFGTGWYHGANCYNLSAENMWIFGNQLSFDIRSGSNLCSYRSCWFKGDNSAGSKLGYIRGNTNPADRTFNLQFFGCGFEAHESGLDIGSATANDKVTSVEFFGGYWEANNDYHALINNGEGVNFYGGYFQMNNNMLEGVKYQNSSWGSVINCMANNIPVGGFFLRSTSAGNRVVAYNNQDIQGTGREVDTSGTFDLISDGGVVTAKTSFDAAEFNAGTDMQINGANVGRTGGGIPNFEFMTDGNVKYTSNGAVRGLKCVDGYIAIKDAVSAPSSEPGLGKIYIDSSDGYLKIVFGDGTVKTIVTDV